MQIDKETILNYLRDRGETEKAQQAESELPNQVDTERDSGLLEQYGINPQDLLAKLGGGGNIPGL